MTRVCFMGTPEFAVPSLTALYNGGYEIVGVFTQPDRPSGRGHKMEAPPVKKEAQRLGLPVYQFERLRKQEGLDALRALEPDIVVTAAFGQILSSKLLAVPKYGTVNVHASLLPKYRGAAPINWCILMGETTAGVTTMLTDAGIDTGDILLSRETEIGDDETAGELTQRLSIIGAELLIDTLPGYLSGAITPTKQDESQMSHQPMLDKEMGRIDWTQPADSIARRVRGLNPWPGCFSGGVKIWKACVVKGVSGVPGTVIFADAKKGVVIACGEDALEIMEMQAPGGKRMTARAYIAGRKFEIGIGFGDE